MSYQPITRTPPKDLHVVIVGGGIGGIALGLMLERANISYVVLERSEKVRPVGSAISLGPNVLRLFDQLGLGKEVRDASKRVRRMAYYDSTHNLCNAKPDNYADMTFVEKRYGYCTQVIPRSVLYDILASKVLPSKILMGKRVVEIAEYEPLSEHTQGHVVCRCTDGTEYTGSLLVGADGTYSTIRRLLYQDLDSKGMLDPRDLCPLPPFQHCMVGVTDSLDPEEFRSLVGEYVDFQVIRGGGGGSENGDSQHSIWLMPLANFRIAWNLFYRYDKEVVQEYQDALEYYASATPKDDADVESSGNGSFASIILAHEKAWRSLQTASREHANRLLASHRTIRNPLSNRRNATLGDLFDKTRPELISSVTMEQGFYHTWYHGRVVLMGDACHKSLPYGGQGANQAILDGVHLANNLVQLESTHLSDLVGCFHDYVQARATIADTARIGSACYGFLFGGSSLLASLFRLAYFWFMPHRLVYSFSDPFFHVRPLLSFLPYVREYGQCRAAPTMNEPGHRMAHAM